jgi:hypothetical protein
MSHDTRIHGAHMYAFHPLKTASISRTFLLNARRKGVYWAITNLVLSRYHFAGCYTLAMPCSSRPSFPASVARLYPSHKIPIDPQYVQGAPISSSSVAKKQCASQLYDVNTC